MIGCAALCAGCEDRIQHPGGSSEYADEASGTEAVVMTNMTEREAWERYAAPLLNKCQKYPQQGFEHFITSANGKLYNGTDEFRFVSLNAAGLTYTTDDTFWENNTENRRRTTACEIEDAIKTVAAMGGQVVRAHTLAIQRENILVPAHVYGPGVYDELLFRDWDRMLAECNRQGVRLILPLINPWPFIGGAKDFDRLCGGPGTLESFYTRRETIEEYKKLLSYIVNRVNTITGIPYREDKAILCWELGNEISYSIEQDPYDVSGVAFPPSPVEWVQEIAGYIKLLDPNHLIMDGGTSPEYLQDGIRDCPDIDILTFHYFAPVSIPGKPVIYGEFDLTCNATQEYFDGIMSCCEGMLAWNLSIHNRYGGHMYRLQDWKTPPLRWPGSFQGINLSGTIYSEKDAMELLRKNAFAVQGKEVPELQSLEPPVLLPLPVKGGISWRGSVGAESYDLYRAPTDAGPWEKIASDLSDEAIPALEVFRDPEAGQETTWFYRVVAKNGDVASEPSNVMPYLSGGRIYADVDEETLGNMLVDEYGTANFIRSSQGEIQYGMPIASIQERTSAWVQSDAELTYELERAADLFSLELYWYKNGVDAVSIWVSQDGREYRKADSLTCISYGEREEYHRGRLEFSLQDDQIKYLKIQISYQDTPENSVYLCRMELYYKGLMVEEGA